MTGTRTSNFDSPNVLGEPPISFSSDHNGVVVMKRTLTRHTLEVPWTGVFSLLNDTISYRLQRYENGGNQDTERY